MDEKATDKKCISTDGAPGECVTEASEFQEGDENLSDLMVELEFVDNEIQKKGETREQQLDQTARYFNHTATAQVENLSFMQVASVKYTKKKRRGQPNTSGIVGLVVAVDSKGLCTVYDPYGNALVEDYVTGHKSPIVDMSTTPSEKPLLTMVSADGTVTIHRVLVWYKGKLAAGRMTRDEKQLFAHHRWRKGEQRKEFGIEIVHQSTTHVWPDKEGTHPQLKAVEALDNRKHTKMITLTDDSGRLHFIWGPEGEEKRESLEVATEPLLSFTRAGQALAVGLREWVHFVHATKWTFIDNKCHLPGVSFSALAYDPALSFVLYAGTTDGELVVFETKQKKGKAGRCKALVRQPIGALEGQAVTALLPLPGFVVVASDSAYAVFNHTKGFASWPHSQGYDQGPLSRLVPSHTAAQEDSNYFFSGSTTETGKDRVTLAVAHASSGGVFFIDHTLPLKSSAGFDLDWKSYIYFLPVLLFVFGQLNGKGKLGGKMLRKGGKGRDSRKQKKSKAGVRRAAERRSNGEVPSMVSTGREMPGGLHPAERSQADKDK
mmetsp:Transcript_23009/g.30039  ORF Transcript_23009/g.30039 Transcript_23009/m.30039 type:complete len:548 (+) Transcript_23009:45-1688(+)